LKKVSGIPLFKLFLVRN